MKTIDRAFPYPVVAPFRDDVSINDFGAELEVLADGGRIYVDCSFQLANEGLAALVVAGKARYALHLEAERVYYRRLVGSPKEGCRIELRGSDVQGPVEWLPLVLSCDGIPDYRPDGLHEDYGGRQFDIQANEVLAIGTGGKFTVEPHYDPLRKMSSIMQVLRSEKTQSGPYEMDPTGEKITVFLSAEDHERYGELRSLPQVEGILCNAIVLPCLVEAIRLIKEEEDLGTRWAIVLRKRLNDLEPGWRDDKEPLDLAQRVLASPLKRGLSDLAVLTGGDD